MRQPLAIALVLLAAAAAGCGWEPYPHHSGSPPAASTGTDNPPACKVECLLAQIRPTTSKAELHRIFRELRRLNVHCTGTPATEISCTGSDAGEGWELGFATMTNDGSG